MPETRPRRLLTAAVVLLSSACASALREPPALDDLALPARHGNEVEAFAEAERLWELRTVDSVQAAADTYQAWITTENAQVQALIGAVRARIWLADHHEDDDVRLDQAERAIALAQWCARVEPGEPECDYRLALALGLQAKERRSTGIDALDRIVKLLQTSIERAPTLDHAGPHRVLALVYLRSPGWPTGPGDPDLGLEQAMMAAELEPQHPPNQLALGEAYREIDEIDSSRKAYREAERLAALVEHDDPEANEWLDQARRALNELERR